VISMILGIQKAPPSPEKLFFVCIIP